MIHKYCIWLVKFLLSEMLLLHLRATHKTTVQGGNHGLWLSCYMAPKAIFSWKMVQNCNARDIYLIDMTLFVAAYLRSITTENGAIKLILKCPTISRTQWINNFSRAAALQGCWKRKKRQERVGEMSTGHPFACSVLLASLATELIGKKRSKCLRDECADSMQSQPTVHCAMNFRIHGM